MTQQVDGRLETTQGEMVRDAAVAGLGVSLHSVWHVHEQIARGELRVILQDYPIPMTHIHAVMPQRRLVPPRVTAFVDFLSAKLGDPPPWERHLSPL